MVVQEEMGLKKEAEEQEIQEEKKDMLLKMAKVIQGQVDY